MSAENCGVSEAGSSSVWGRAPGSMVVVVELVVVVVTR